MACNPKKDMSKCVAKMRVKVYDTRYFWDVYLWPDYDTQHAQAAVDWDADDPLGYNVILSPRPPSVAFVCRNPHHFRYTPPKWAPAWLWAIKWPPWLRDRLCHQEERWWPKLGEIHFVRGKGWSMEAVNHECLHATITTAHVLGVDPRNIFDGTGQLSARFKETPVYIDASKSYEVSLNDEELFCYIQGMLFDAVYTWLWTVDPPRNEWELP